MMNDDTNRIRIGDHVTIYRRGKRQIYTADFWHAGEHCRVSLKTRNKKVAHQRGLRLELQLAQGEYQVLPKSKAIEDAIEAVLLKSFLKWCKQRRLLVHNPMEDMTFQKPLTQSKGGPSVQQINRLLDAASDTRLTQFATLAFTRMRSGELQRLKPEDVDLAGNWIHVVSRDGAETKTGHSRKVPIHPRLLPYLKSMPTRSRTWFFAANPSLKYPDGNHHISTKHLNEDLQKVLRRLDIPTGRDGGFTVHSLRHSFETICINAGIPQRVVDTWRGHRSDTSMASIYYRLSDADSPRFINQVPFGSDQPPTDGGESEC